MFKSEPMNEVNIILLRDDLKRVTQTLYDLKLMQFFKVKEEKLNKFEADDLQEVSARLLKVRSAMTFLKEHFTFNEKKRIADFPVKDSYKLKEKLEKLEKEVSILNDEVKREKILKNLRVTKSDIKNKDVTIGFISNSESRLLKSFVRKRIKHRSFLFGKRLYFIAHTNKKNIGFEFKEFYVPKQFGDSVQIKFKEKSFELNKLKTKIRDFANNNLGHLKKEEVRLSKEISISDAKRNFATSKNITVLNGFVPKKSLGRLKYSLDEILLDKYNFEVFEANDNAPVKLKNPTYANNFESLLKMYSLPKYTEIDPTTLMFLVFPIFFGFILGDFVYGLISIIVFTIMKYKLPKIKEFLAVLQLSSVSSMIFGVIFGEFMGYEIEGHFLGIPYGIFSRAHHPETLLLYAVIFGAIHVNMGVFISFLNNIKDLKKAITHDLSWIIMQVGAGMMGYGFSFGDTLIANVGVVVFVIAMVLILMGHGIMGLMELPGIFGNILSYARLMAVGLSSVIIALIVNEFTAMFFQGGIIGIIAGIILFTTGHILNIVLGNFESFLHSLRLHYVEFFTKFYEGDGQEFIPFGQRVEED